jgi:hypothetical protein
MIYKFRRLICKIVGHKKVSITELDVTYLKCKRCSWTSLSILELIDLSMKRAYLMFQEELKRTFFT